MPLDHARVADEVVTVLIRDTRVLGIGAQRDAATGDEVQHPIELRVGESGIRPRRFQLGHDPSARETTANGACHQVLREQIERSVDWITALDPTGADRVARGGNFHQLKGMRRHTHDLRYAARRMSRASSALQQSRDALRAANLHHQIDRREVHAEVEGRCRDDGAEPARFQAFFDDLTLPLIERTMMNRDRLEPLRPRRDDRLIPDFALRTRVGEDDRRVGRFDPVQHLWQQLCVQMASPREALHLFRHQRLDYDLLRHDAAHQHAGICRSSGIETEQRGACHVEITECG